MMVEDRLKMHDSLCVHVIMPIRTCAYDVNKPSRPPAVAPGSQVAADRTFGRLCVEVACTQALCRPAKVGKSHSIYTEWP